MQSNLDPTDQAWESWQYSRPPNNEQSDIPMDGFSDTFSVRLSNVRISNGRNRTYLSGFQMVASLDRFIKKRVINKILFIIKWSSLAVRISNVGLSNGVRLSKSGSRQNGPHDNRNRDF
jgi:hypothetical protein